MICGAFCETRDFQFIWILYLYLREVLAPVAEMASLAPPETLAPLDLQDLMDPLALVEWVSHV